VVVLAVGGSKADRWNLKDVPESVNFCVRNTAQFQGVAEPFEHKVAQRVMIKVLDEGTALRARGLPDEPRLSQPPQGRGVDVQVIVSARVSLSTSTCRVA
jgi:hypothetical protein